MKIQCQSCKPTYSNLIYRTLAYPSFSLSLSLSFIHSSSSLLPILSFLHNSRNPQLQFEWMKCTTKIEPQNSKLTYLITYTLIFITLISLSFIHSASYRSFMDDCVGGNLLRLNQTNHVEQFHQQKQKEHAFRLSFLQSM